MLHKSKGKWKFQRKATYSVEYGLNPIILAYLEKLKECIEKAKSCGVPIYYCDLQAKTEGYERYDWDIEIDLDKAHQLRLKDLDEIIWTFQNNELNILDYAFSIDMEYGEQDEKNCREVKLTVNNEEERERYHRDLKAYNERKTKGYELYGKLLIKGCLDW